MMSNPNDRIVILSFNRSVMQDMQQTLRDIVPEEYHNKIHFYTIYNYFKCLINKYDAKTGSKLEYLKNTVCSNSQLKLTSTREYKEIISESINNMQKEFRSSTLWQKYDYRDFIQTELEWMTDNAISYDNLDDYLSAERIGRGHYKISQDQRHVMYSIYQEINCIRRKHSKLFSYRDI
jgi:hypothetical protein